MECFRISQTETLQLINLYKQSEQLWNYKSHLYKRVDLKKKAWEKIAKQFKRDVKDVKKKIKYLRSAYVAEKKKMDDTIKSGAGADEVHQPHLFYFSAFSFLDNVIVLRKIESNYNDDTMERANEAREYGEHGDYDEFNDDPLLSSTTYRNGRQQNTTAKCEEAIMSSTSQVSEPDEHNKFTDFGKNIANQLKDLSPIEATAAMADLQQNLTRHVIRSLEKTQCSAIFKMEKLVEQRGCLKFCVKNNISCAEALKILQKTYGESCLSETQAYEWYKAFKDDRHNVDLPGYGSSSTATSDEEDIDKMK